MCFPRRVFRHSLCGAFSLIELLVVITIVVLMASMSAHLFSTVPGALTMTEASSQFTSILNLGRTMATAHNTYVWVGLSNPAGVGNQVYVSLVEGRTGQSSDLNTTGADLRLITKPCAFPYVNIGADVTALLNELSSHGLTMSGIDSTGANLPISGLPTFSANVAGKASTFDAILQFSPAGDAVIPATTSSTNSTIPPWINIGLKCARNAKTTDVAVIQVSGFGNEIRLFQP